ncbi:MAG: glycosyltransferase family 2 protein, partial [Lachnospiraceae bacterium]|nr:glycosyltransferase family 2 protein [Lachnospiraceae bacterium]
MTISVCIVALNEEEYLPDLLNDIESQTYPHECMEIVLIDSGSSDKTKPIMERFKEEKNGFKNIKVLDNPKKKQAAGWNVAIKNFTCDVLVRIDAHSKIPSDFVEKNIFLLESGENISGGVRPCIIVNENEWTKTLLQAENSMFGSSINACRRSGEKQYVKTMFHAAYRREVFEKVGGFNENLGRTEDNELHYRMRQAGYKFCFNPDIVSYQYARSSLKNMLKQKYGNGYWIGLTLGVCPQCLSLFYFVPFAFVCAILFTLILSLFGIYLLGELLAGAYTLAALAMTLMAVRESGYRKFSFMLPLLFFLLHTSYG